MVMVMVPLMLIVGIRNVVMVEVIVKVISWL